MKPEERQILEKYFPECAIDMVSEIIDKECFLLKITKSRRTKFGDFRPPKQKGDICCISINNDLHPYQMLITFVHEVAHKIVFDKYGRKVQPHGMQWQNEYRKQLQPYLIPSIFPQEIIQILQKSLICVHASSSCDLDLMRQINSYSTKESNTTFLEDLPEGAKFCLSDGRIFIKCEKLRKRFKCRCLENNLNYMVNPLAQVKLIDLDNHQEIEHSTKLLLKDLDKGTKFRIPDGRIFIKQEKLRKYFNCQSVTTKKWYSVHPLVEVEIV